MKWNWLRILFQAIAAAFRAKQSAPTPQPPAVITPPPSVAPEPPTPTIPPGPTQIGQPSLLHRFCTAMQLYEGYILPGGKDAAGNVYPVGSPAFRHKNPGNLRCLKGDNAHWNVLAIGCDNNFCIFPDYDTGFQALENVTKAAAMGKSLLYNARAKSDYGLADASELNLYQYFYIRDNPSDGNFPYKFADFVARQLGVDSRTFQMKTLLL